MNISATTPDSTAAIIAAGSMTDPTDGTFNIGPTGFSQVTIGTNGKGRLTLPFSASAQISTQTFDMGADFKARATFDLVVVIKSIIGPDGTTTF